jgi:N-formylglutamate deformylase
MEKPQLILHIPHSSPSIPCKDGFKIADTILDDEILKLTDWHTDDLFSSAQDITVLAPFSRIFCDVERFQDDNKEAMARFGMGVLYKKTGGGDAMRCVTPELRARILDNYYEPHHRALTAAVKDQLDRWSFAMIIDCHSFPDKPLMRSLNKQTPRPDFNIGTDAFHTPADLVKLSEAFFREKGYSVGIDWPYHGSVTPTEFYQKNPNVSSIMLEVNRKLYLKENSNKKSNDYAHIKRLVRDFLQLIRLNLTETALKA